MASYSDILGKALSFIKNPNNAPLVYAAGGGALGWLYDKLKKKKKDEEDSYGGTATGALIGLSAGALRKIIHNMDGNTIADNLKKNRRKSVGRDRVGNDAMDKNVLSGERASRSGATYIKGSDGSAYITPRQARINIYRDAFSREHGEDYEMGEADRTSESDMSAAQKKRFEQIVKSIPKFKNDKFDPQANYSIMTDNTFKSPSKSIVRFGSLDDKIPIVDKDSRGSVELTAYEKFPRNGVISFLNLGMKPDLAKMLDRVFRHDPYDIFLHEGNHTATPIDKLKSGWTTFFGPEADAARQTADGNSGYASGPAEALVAILAEKARMRAAGDDGSYGMGRRWADAQLKGPRTASELAQKIMTGVERVKSRVTGAVPDRIKKMFEKKWNEDNRGISLNIKSLRHILFDLYDKAHRKDATDSDKERYREFIRSLDYYFDLAKNGSGRRSRIRAMA